MYEFLLKNRMENIHNFRSNENECHGALRI